TRETTDFWLKTSPSYNFAPDEFLPTYIFPAKVLEAERVFFILFTSTKVVRLIVRERRCREICDWYSIILPLCYLCISIPLRVDTEGHIIPELDTGEDTQLKTLADYNRPDPN